MVLPTYTTVELPSQIDNHTIFAFKPETIHFDLAKAYIILLDLEKVFTEKL